MKLCVVLAVCIATAYGQSDGTCVSSAEIGSCNDCWNPPLECVTCADRWWWKDLNTCLRCSDNCLSCKDSNNDDTTECVECESFYYKTSDECKTCAGHCEDCIEDFQCNTCEPRFRLEDEQPIKCEGCYIGCNTCIDGASSSCVDCLDGYYFVQTRSEPDTGRCLACGAFCNLCKSGTTCDECVNGYTWAGTSCIPCITHCDVCLTNGGCSSCDAGYFLTVPPTSPQCRSCVHCVEGECLDGGCVTCEPGYILNDDGTCHACPNVNDVLTCSQCSSDTRARFFSANTCLYCPLNCASCTDADICGTCYEGFYRDANNQCQACDNTCRTCSDAGSDNCLSCVTGFGLVDRACIACPEATGTLQCTVCSGRTCTDCQTGNFQVSFPQNNDPAECRSCTTYEANESSSSCVECAPASRGRFLSVDKCVGCEEYGASCVTCTSATCTQCADGTYFDAGTDECENCDDANCRICSSDGSRCSSCNDEFDPDSNGICQPCVDGCKVCTNSFTCSECLATLFKQYDTLCSAQCTVPGCATCDTSLDACAECLSGHFRAADGSSCTACTVDGCLTCNTDAAMCDACEPGFVRISATECRECGVERCATCTTDADVPLGDTTVDNESCDMCDSGYFTTDQAQCHVDNDGVFNCARQGEYGVCVLCDPGYYVDSGRCLACGIGCVTCTDVSTCTLCDVTFHDAAVCTGCLDNCGVCTGTNANYAECTSCLPGYEKDAVAMTCVAVTTVGCGLNCAKCETATPTNCLVCESTFYSAAGMCAGCASDCATCTGNTGADCTSCVSGRGGTAPACDMDCPNVDCLTCTSPTMCTLCNEGKSGDLCTTACTGTIPCKTCAFADAAMCTSCNDGSFLDTANSNVCTGCPTNCATCTSGTVCLTCMSGYQLNLVTKMCDAECTNAGIPNCDFCATVADGCTQCAAGYGYYNRDSCTSRCADNCAVCVNGEADQCTQCKPGYLLTGGPPGTCSDIVCTANCAICNDVNTCTTCATGYRLVVAGTAGACEACVTNCDTCTNALNICANCADGYDMEPVCTDCRTEECETCDPIETCTKCNSGRYLLTTGTTTTCPPCTASDCVTCANNICTGCRTGFKLSGTSCVALTGNGIANCADETGGVCTICDDGFFLDPATNVCIDCDATNKDNNKYACLLCKGHGTLYDDVQDWLAECLDCPTNCISCFSATTCIACVDGMYTDGTECFPLSCTLSAITHETACSACSEINFDSDDEHRGLYWDASATCKECPRNCRQCRSETTCSGAGESCEDTFVWSSAEGACIACDFTTDESKCTGCVSGNRGRYLDASNRCLLCDEFCTACKDDSSTCTACANTHYLDDSTDACHSCDTVANEAGCVSCDATYLSWYEGRAWMVDTSVEGADAACLSCPTNCRVCSEFNTCTTCYPHLYFNLETKVCTSCITNCDTCSSDGTCDDCYSGYYYRSVNDANSCESCPANCLDCTHADGCTACVSGFYLTADNTCSACSTAIANCASCILNGENVECQSCNGKFYPATLGTVNGGQCADCIANCEICDSDIGCDVCQAGYCYDKTEEECLSSTGINCDLCEKRDGDVSCLTCYDGTYLDLCQACDDSLCLACNEADNICTECVPGAYLTSTDDCSPCAFGCLLCSDGTTCSDCLEGSYWDTTALSCQPCLSGCVECNDGDTCSTCAIPGSYEDTTVTPNLCVQCFVGCADCRVNPLQCEECHVDYYPTFSDDGESVLTCTSCGVGCASCTSNDGVTVTCDVCADGYAMVGGVCTACSTFGNCYDCMDITSNAVLDAGDCLECAPGYVISEDLTQCISCSISGCVECQDRNFVCEECNGDLEPTLEQYECASPCYFCENDEECSTAPVLNGTEVAVGSAYSTLGCTNGCSVVRNETSDGIIYQRSCFPEDLNCGQYSGEACDIYGEGTAQVTECRICCTTNLCNTMELKGEDSGAQAVVAGSLAAIIVLLLL